MAAARKRDELETQVIETKALRRSNVVKTAVLRSVSHDLRSPLTAITTAAGGLASETLSPEARAELTSVIALESGRLSRLVDNLLDLSRLQAGGVEPHADWCSIEELVRAAIDSVARAAGRVRHPGRRRPAAGARRTPVSSSARSPTCSRTPARYAGDEPVSVRARAASNQVLLRIGDRGPGIAARGARARLRALSLGRRGLGHRARAGDRARLRGGERRPHPRRVAARPGHDDRAQPARARRAARRGGAGVRVE